MDRVSVLCVVLLLCSLSGAELQDNKITEQRNVSPEIKNVQEQPQSCSDLRTVLHEVSAKLGVLQTKMEQMQALNQAQANELKSIKAQADLTKDHVDTLKRNKDVTQVAFSASLLTSGSGHTGPFNTFTDLVFRNVITNIGNAYNSSTGYFTAPVRGAYHFEFYISSYGNSHQSGAGLVKNGQLIVIAYETEVNSWSQSANGATLLLEPDDVVSLRLWPGARVYDTKNGHNSFSGRLLFTM